jgi:2,4-dienoyl-CoA reductase-like NADH-dependent reductase (Old Yellow Enzyme family)
MLDSLWTPTTLGGISLPHRLVMAPMTRDRSTPEGVPTELNAEYYAQRAVSVGALALANPDLVERLSAGTELNTPDPATFYGGGVAGYTDDPTHTV